MVVGDAAELFDPLDAEAIRGAIERVVTSEMLRNDLKERGYCRCALFSWKRCAEETLAIYRKLKPEQG